MKKFLLFAIALLCCLSGVNAQDLLTRTNGEEVEVIVKEINETSIKYVLFSEPNGVLYTVPKSDVLIIRYASGRNEVFSNNTISKQQQINNRYGVDYGGGNLIYPGMKYKELKGIYDYVEWRGGYERYSPFWCGFGSFFIPGLGQMCCGEWGRGLCFMGSNIVLNVLSNYAPTYETYLACAISGLGLCIWSIVDASRVAKVKNMYETDLHSQYLDISIDLYPSIAPTIAQDGMGVVSGMTLSVSF
ncbi:MAG: hypothetical protein IKB03_02660 [Tidjanibacter sp.]|nr:hypothetical protein [Tidjanibacter sp.]